MEKMTIGIIVGSIRHGRVGTRVGQWVAEQVADSAFDYELVELADWDIPFATTEVIPAMAGGTYDDPRVQAWADKVAGFDAFVFVTPEYNRNVPGPFKNAFDSVAEWKGKPVTFVAYGSGGGRAAIAGWRTTVTGLLAMDPTASDTALTLGREGIVLDDAASRQLRTAIAELEGKLS